MILDITSRCNGNCIHCMSRCTEDGIDITDQCLKDTIKFIKLFEISVINIGGGEPTLHPNFVNIIKQIKNECNSTIVLCTNGTFVRDSKLFNGIKELNIIIQTTYQKDLYKTNLTRDEIEKLKQIGYVELNEPSQNRLLAYGRALDNKLKTSTTRLSPPCFNIRSMIKNNNMQLMQAIQQLEILGKYCCPNIIPDGSIIVGESMCCPSIGSIYDDPITITNNIHNFHCIDCIYAKQLLQYPIYKNVFI